MSAHCRTTRPENVHWGQKEGASIPPLSSKHLTFHMNKINVNNEDACQCVCQHPWQTLPSWAVFIKWRIIVYMHVWRRAAVLKPPCHHRATYLLQTTHGNCTLVGVQLAGSCTAPTGPKWDKNTWTHWASSYLYPCRQTTRTPRASVFSYVSIQPLKTASLAVSDYGSHRPFKILRNTKACF